MSRWTLLLRTLLFHWRTNLAVGLGVVAGTAVIGGALIVGDSVRGSLLDMTLARLGHVDHALSGPKFIRKQLVSEMASGLLEKNVALSAAIVLQGSAEQRAPDGDHVLTRAGRVNIIGVGRDFPVPVGIADADDGREQVVLSERLAHDLQVTTCDEVT